MNSDEFCSIQDSRDVNACWFEMYLAYVLKENNFNLIKPTCNASDLDEDLE